jgi:hypothetical protein
MQLLDVAVDRSHGTLPTSQVSERSKREND